MDEKETIESTEELANRLQDQLLRARAEIENMRKRNERSVAEAIAYGQAGVLEKLLGVWDQLSLGAEHAVSEDKVHEGLGLVFKNIEQLMNAYGVVKVDTPVGQKYDPHFHEVLRMEDSEKEDGTILSVVQQGFLFGGRVLRSSKVVVAKNKGG